MDDLKKLIQFIMKNYIIINDQWVTNINYSSYNMNNLKIDKILSDEKFSAYVRAYRSFINDNIIIISKELQNLNFTNVTCRVKHLNSIQDKISRYANHKKHENGKVSVNKCLNDLLGFRIIVEDDISFHDIKSLVSNGFPTLRCISANRNEYIAVHIYFRNNDNRKFQWELQIWNSKNADGNYKAHEKYKQEYTKWEDNFKEDENNG